MILARQMCTVEALSVERCSGFTANTPQETEESQLNLSESSYPSWPPILRGLSCPSHERRLSTWKVDFKCCFALQNKPSVDTGGSDDPLSAAAGLNRHLKWTRRTCVPHSWRKLQGKQGYTPRRVARYSTGLHQACVLRLLA